MASVDTARRASRRDYGATDNAQRRGSGLDFRVATSLDEVIAAWKLVYRAYLRAGLIPPNAQEIHTNPGVIQQGTAVVVGMLGGEVCATISAYLDSPDGLPLDAVYATELAELRAKGHRLVEVGLLADRRAKLSRSLEATLRLMKSAYFWGLLNGMTDIIVGVHPHHSGFYQRIFGFQVVGEESTCPWVNGAPVVPLRLKLEMVERSNTAPRGLRYFMNEPLELSEFDGRFIPDPDAIRGTLIESRLGEILAP
jgi:N-acyl amino acid synthase FeeM